MLEQLNNEKINENELLRDMLIKLKDKLKIQLDECDDIKEILSKEHKLKRRLQEEVHSRLLNIRDEDADVSKQYQKEMTGLELDNEKMNNENKTLKGQIDELKNELLTIRGLNPKN